MIVVCRLSSDGHFSGWALSLLSWLMLPLWR